MMGTALHPTLSGLSYGPGGISWNGEVLSRLSGGYIACPCRAVGLEMRVRRLFASISGTSRTGMSLFAFDQACSDEGQVRDADGHRFEASAKRQSPGMGHDDLLVERGRLLARAQKIHRVNDDITSRVRDVIQDLVYVKTDLSDTTAPTSKIQRSLRGIKQTIRRIEDDVHRIKSGPIQDPLKYAEKRTPKMRRPSAEESPEEIPIPSWVREGVEFQHERLGRSKIVAVSRELESGTRGRTLRVAIVIFRTQDGQRHSEKFDGLVMRPIFDDAAVSPPVEPTPQAPLPLPVPPPSPHRDHSGWLVSVPENPGRGANLKALLDGGKSAQQPWFEIFLGTISRDSRLREADIVTVVRNPHKMISPLHSIGKKLAYELVISFMEDYDEGMGSLTGQTVLILSEDESGHAAKEARSIFLAAGAKEVFAVISTSRGKI